VSDLAEIAFDVEAYVSDEVNRLRFRWRLHGPGEPPQSSKESFATRREAAAAGEIARLRAIQRGRVAR
jgi:hypothetical protein